LWNDVTAGGAANKAGASSKNKTTGNFMRPKLTNPAAAAKFKSQSTIDLLKRLAFAIP
jgi:hypothetical protein